MSTVYYISFRSSFQVYAKSMYGLTLHTFCLGWLISFSVDAVANLHLFVTSVVTIVCPQKATDSSHLRGNSYFS